jgi:hypothetical protein
VQFNKESLCGEFLSEFHFLLYMASVYDATLDFNPLTAGLFKCSQGAPCGAVSTTAKCFIIISDHGKNGRKCCENSLFVTYVYLKAAVFKRI